MRVLAIALIIGLLLAVPGSAQQPSEKLGTVNFPTSCNSAAQTEFSRAVALLHSFWFSYAIKGFEATVQADPSCGIAYWGVAVARLGNPLAGAPPAKDVELGAATVAKGKSVGAKTQRELDYLAAIETFYKDYDKVDHRTRAQNYEKAMEALAARYPQDREAAIFYALALNATLNPNDKTYANQLKAAAILEKVFAEQPNHPGVAHYLIHSYDFPPIANKGLDAARSYAKIAPSAPHAQHMPSHIFTRLGYWQESIDTNRASVEAAKDELRQAKLEAGSYNALHAMDYIEYATLQLVKDQRGQGGRGRSSPHREDRHRALCRCLRLHGDPGPLRAGAPAVGRGGRANPPPQEPVVAEVPTGRVHSVVRTGPGCRAGGQCRQRQGRSRADRGAPRQHDRRQEHVLGGAGGDSASGGGGLDRPG